MVKNYEEIKKRVVLLGGFVLMFLVGFGTGDYVKDKTPVSSPTNYTTKTVSKPFLSLPAGQAGAPAVPSKPAINDPISSTTPTSSTSSKSGSLPIDLSNCLIKGNISSDGRKIYHVLGGQSYKRLTHPKACFNTEDEAKAAGFVKAKR